MEDRAAEQESDVLRARDVGVHDLVPLAVHADPDAADRERVAVPDDVHARARPAHGRRDGVVAPDVQPCLTIEGLAHPVDGQVIAMVVGDQHGSRPVECLRLGEHPRIDDHGRLAVGDPDARVPELRHRQSGHGAPTALMASSMPRWNVGYA
jgi:hypothetical protein